MRNVPVSVAESTEDLFVALKNALPHSETHRALREELISRHMSIVDYIARRFSGRGEPHDDLVQVGMIGLIRAIDRFDAAHGASFTTYVTPCVLGEMKRHFRDRTWAIHVPRRLQENALAVTQATSELFVRHAQAPTIRELAAEVGLEEEEVLEALEAARAHNTIPLQDGQSEGHPHSEHKGHEIASEEAEIAFEQVEHRASLRPMLAILSQQERQVVILRFMAGMTQSQIAASLGISQMHVSRLLSRSLERLRDSNRER